MFPLDFHCFGFEWPASFEGTTARVWLNEDGDRSGVIVLAAAPLPGTKGIGFVGARPGIADGTDTPEESWKRFCSANPSILEIVRERQFPRDFVSIRRGWGHVSQYGTGGAILIGDAAHPVTPIGGQGANMSVADACVLAELGLADAKDLLAEYERRRRPANERSMEFSKWATRLWSLPGWCGPVSIFQNILRCLARYPGVMRRAVRTAATAFETTTN